MSYLSPKLNAIMHAWRMNMAIYGSASFKNNELAAIADEITRRKEREKQIWGDLNALETEVINAKPIK